MLRLKTFSVLIHLACWLLFMAFPLLFLNGPDGNVSMGTIIASPYYWLFCATYIALFYLNTNFLFPRFFLRKKYIDYAIICCCLLSAVYVLKPYDKLLHSINKKAFAQMAASQFGQPPMGFPAGASLNFKPDSNGQQSPPPQNMQQPDSNQRARISPGGMPPPQFRERWRNGRRRHFDSSSLFLFLMIMALSTAIKTVVQWQTTEQRAISAEAEKASAELSFLKAQINPHFLFNTLNNIYTLAITNNEHTADSIMKLSNIMRYVTDEVKEDFVDLQNEVSCIANYIDLQRLRLGAKTVVSFTVQGDLTNRKIAPILLMTFVENVFKYGISKQHQSNIDINLLVKPDAIVFFCVNPIFERKQNLERTGIGINNTRERLKYLYPGKHILNINEENDQFTVILTLYS
ncbi:MULTISPECIES: sensor histidine kinase [unclassified Mucilaginibacter]|uniref:sensor histidine kinase n=1 Tax=unclassified Mucilaginibacter TaxID=2617802 RepID=UPI0009617029|nr:MULTISPECIES: sensor histidine kinase [unclassified Mucilaginibacter]OJW16477.1 MAG: hypothetical protein BGO48_09895 [Mucilaginibacter sp. 44-25]PLW89087.1 MAG: hypothetical protein C0154_13330 [Mucilaginibacter sp.]